MKVPNGDRIDIDRELDATTSETPSIVTFLPRSPMSSLSKFAKQTITLLAIASLCLILPACTDGDKTTRILSDAGYSDITLTGYKFFACSSDDNFHTGFVGVSSNKKKITGTVCSAFLKSATIRID
jgi:hypothetical protein